MLRLIPHYLLLTITLLLTIIQRDLLAQEGQRPQPPPAFSSIEVDSDRNVTLRIWAPNAKKIRVAGGDMPGVSPNSPSSELKMGENGVWETKIGPVPSGSYRYLFDVDGLSVIDPRNPATSESNSNTWSLLTVPGSEVSDLKDVPHGAVASLSYHSKSLNQFRRAHVYTPPGYEHSDKNYPVFYLLHGASDSDASWSTIGRAGLVLDNLIASGRAVPMIVVMPAGHVGAFRFGPGGGDFQKQMDDFQIDFTKDLKPLVETRYRISNERKSRAIAGLSMGGAQTLNVAMANLGDYGYIGVFSSGVFGINGTGPGGGAGDAWEKKHDAVLNDKALKQGLQLFWFATGKEDFLLKTTEETVKVLRARGFDVTYDETDGGHTWIKWREHYLPVFAEKLFR